MKPLHQTVTEPGKGNCLAACIASILEVPIEAVPDLDCGRDIAALKAFLATRNLAPIWIHAPDLQRRYVGLDPCYCVLIGPSPRRPGVMHAVVGSPMGYGYSFVHDPHPSGTFIAGDPVSVLYFGALDPTLLPR